MTKQSVVVPADENTVAAGLSANNIGSLYDILPRKPVGAGVAECILIKKKKMLMKKKLETNGNNNNNVNVNVWLESMRASSPTHVHSIGLSMNLNEKHHQITDSNWIISPKYRLPSALSNFDEIVRSAAGKQIVMFLDYDGTLSPIVEDPDRAFMSNEMRQAVRDIARYFPTAIVSGRCRDKVYGFVKLGELYYAGSHGMDIKGPVKSPRFFRSLTKSLDKNKVTEGVDQFQPEAASEILPVIDEVYKKLVEKMQLVPGSKVENNKFCVSVHFRCVEEKRWGMVAEEVKNVVKDYPNKLKLTQGRKVLEIRPTIQWDKGRALLFLLEALGFANCDDVLPIYIGDDRTDEDAFKVLRERGEGIGILVSKIPKDTNASYSLKEPAEVMDFLHRLVHYWKKRHSL